MPLLMRVKVCVLMRTYATKIIRNVLLERAITGIGARSPCAIYPLNNIKRDIMPIMSIRCTVFLVLSISAHFSCAI